MSLIWYKERVSIYKQLLLIKSGEQKGFNCKTFNNIEDALEEVINYIILELEDEKILETYIAFSSFLLGNGLSSLLYKIRKSDFEKARERFFAH